MPGTRPPASIATLVRLQRAMAPWSMVEVLFFGVLVALIKIADYADVISGASLYAIGALVVVLAGMRASFDAQPIWARMTWVDERARTAGSAP